MPIPVEKERAREVNYGPAKKFYPYIPNLVYEVTQPHVYIKLLTSLCHRKPELPEIPSY